MTILGRNIQFIAVCTLFATLTATPIFAQLADNDVQMISEAQPPSAVGSQESPIPDAGAAIKTTPDIGSEANAATLAAKVIEVSGRVQYAPIGADPLDEQSWKPVLADMELGSDTQIRTGLRSHCTLLFGDEPDQTVISVRRATLACIADVFRSQDEQRVRIGLGYGAIRGGSTEGRLRSDVVIDSPVATLAKRGTEGFEMEVAPVGDFFRVSLARSGLVTALSRTQAMRRNVRPGEYVSQRTIARTWVNQEVFDRTVKFFPVGSMSAADTDFVTRTSTGFSNLAPGGGSELRDLAGREQSADTGNDQQLNTFDMLVFTPEPTPEFPEGNFGFGSRIRISAPNRDIVRDSGIRRTNQGIRAMRSSLSNQSRRSTSGIRR